MKKVIAVLLSTTLALAISVQCNKNDKPEDGAFCIASRTVAAIIKDRSGTVGYYEKYKRYSIVLDSIITNNIDTRYVGLICAAPDKLNIGDRVTVDGTLCNFNANENIKPMLGGEHLYYLELTAINKLP